MIEEKTLEMPRIKAVQGERKHQEDLIGMSAHLAFTYSDRVPYLIPIEGMDNLFKKVEDNDDTMFFKVFTMLDVVIGVFLGSVRTDVPVAEIEHWFILPKYRTSTVPFRTLKDFEIWARERGAQAILLGGMMGMTKEKANRIGYTKEFINYVKEF